MHDYYMKQREKIDLIFEKYFCCNMVTVCVSTGEKYCNSDDEMIICALLMMFYPSIKMISFETFFWQNSKYPK